MNRVVGAVLGRGDTSAVLSVPMRDPELEVGVSEKRVVRAEDPMELGVQGRHPERIVSVEASADVEEAASVRRPIVAEGDEGGGAGQAYHQVKPGSGLGPV